MLFDIFYPVLHQHRSVTQVPWNEFRAGETKSAFADWANHAKIANTGLNGINLLKAYNPHTFHPID